MIGYIKKFKSFIPEFIWEYFRLRSILKSHAAVASYWDGVLAQYENGEIEKYPLKAKKVIPNSEKIIWQYWGQGYSQENVPAVVQRCFDSVDKFSNGYTVIRLCDDDLNDYIEFPKDVWEKYRTGIVGATHFTDLIRIALLTAYGGVWLDATILLTAPLEDKLTNNDYFLYQRDWAQEDKKLWRRTYAYYFSWHKDFKVRMLSSIIYSKRGALVISELFQLMLHYWRTQNGIIDYFFFQILFTQYIQRFPQRNCRVLSDCLPNMLQMYITGSYRRYSIPEIFKKISIHKLSYKTVSVEDMKEFDDMSIK